MSKLFRFRKTLALLVTVAMFVSLFAGVVFAEEEDLIERLAGANRYETAAKIANYVYPGGAATVVIANGEDGLDYADALAGSFLAGAAAAPILLTKANSLPEATEDAIEDLGATKAYVLGGTAAVSGAVETALDDLGLEVERLAGADRYGTAAKVMSAGIAELGTGADTALIANGVRPADALVAGSYACSVNIPILLVKQDSIPDVTEAALEDIDNTFVIGGTAVVSDVVKDALPNATRVSGPDRYATSVAVAKDLWGSPPDFALAHGKDGIVDALAGSILGVPILYTSSIPQVVQDYLDSVITENSRTFVLGGTARISEDDVDIVREMIVEKTPVELQVASISALNLNQIEVKFNKEVDKDTALEKYNYILDNGTTAGRLSAWANPNLKLSPDNKTVTITIDTTQTTQLENQIEAELVVENVKSKDLSQTIAKYAKKFTVVDTSAPVVDKVEMLGNKVLEIYFSEPVTGSTTLSNYRLDGQSLSSFGLDGAIVYSATSLRATITFNDALAQGTHTLRVSNDNNITDLVGLKLLQSDKQFTVTNDTSVGRLVKVNVDNDKTYIELEFSKPIAKATDFDGNNAIVISPAGATQQNVFTTGNFTLSVVGGKLRIAAGTVPMDTLVAGGTHAVNVYNDTNRWVKDAFGIKYAASSTSYYIEEDTTKPEVTNVAHATATAVDVTFSKKVTAATAENIFNYTIKDVNDNNVNITNAAIRDGFGGKVVRLTIGTGYASGTAKITVSGIKCTSAGKTMDSYSGTFTLGEKSGPTVTSVAVSASNNRVIYVTYSKNVDSTTATAAENYRWKDAALPVGTTLSQTGSAVVKITVPLGQTVSAGQEFAVSGNVTDTYGNKLAGFGWSGSIDPITNDLNVADWGSNNVRATAKNKIEFRLDRELSNIDISEFEFGGSPFPAGSTISYVNIDGQARVTITLPSTDYLNLNESGTPVTAVASATLTQALDGRTFPAAGQSLGSTTDYIAPELTATSADRVRTVDANGNGKIDTLIVEFQENMNAADFSASSFSVSGYTVTAAYPVAAASFAAAISDNTAADGKFVKIYLTEKAFDTASTPAVTFNGTMRDASTANKNKLLLPSSAITATDKAAPAVASIAYTKGATAGTIEGDETIVITFSEATNGPTLTASDFTITGTGNLNSATFAWNTAKTVLTITLGASTDLVDNDTLAFATASTLTDTASTPNNFGTAVFLTVDEGANF